LRHRRVLVVDDEPYILRALMYLLRREGYTVETAADGIEGLARARAFRPEVVFLDMMMPQLNGLQVVEQMRRDPTFGETYVIMLTARGQSADREAGLAAGANEYMTKPFSPRELVQRLERIFASWGSPTGAERN
jgi:DNA-binding response OmpR family regulator